MRESIHVLQFKKLALSSTFSKEKWSSSQNVSRKQVNFPDKKLSAFPITFFYSDGPRQIYAEPTVVYGRIGETRHLECEANCQPAPFFKWLINGYEIFENINIRDATSTLEVNLNSENDFQNYTCLASNDHGESNQIFLLKERIEAEQSTSKTSKTAGICLYTFLMLISTFLIYQFTSHEKICLSKVRFFKIFTTKFHIVPKINSKKSFPMACYFVVRKYIQQFDARLTFLILIIGIKKIVHRFFLCYILLFYKYSIPCIKFL